MIIEAEEQKIDKGLNTSKVLQSRPPFSYYMVYQNEKIRPLSLVLISYLFVQVTSPTAVYCHQEIRLLPPSEAEFMYNCHVLREVFLYFYTCHHCLNILTYKFKCTDKSSSICMTARDDNDDGAFVKQPCVLHSIKFQNVFLCMSMYLWELQ